MVEHLLTSAVVSLLAVSMAHAAEPTPLDFAEAVEVTFSGGGPIYRVDLPILVYSHAAHHDLSDVRLFNSNGDSVPFDIMKRDDLRAKKLEAPVFSPVPYVSVEVESSNPNDQSVELSTDAQGRVSGIKIGEAKENEKMTSSAFIIDLRGTERAISALAFDWSGASDGKFIFVNVEQSDDLKDWAFVQEGVLISTQGLQQKTLSFSYGISKKALRVTFKTAAKDLKLEQVAASAPAVTVDNQVRNSLSLNGVTENGELVYDTGGAFPVTLALLLVPEGTANSITLSSSEKREGPYTSRGSGTVYNFSLSGGASRSKAIELPEVHDRFLKVQIQGSANQLLSVPPQLEISWIPEQLVFVKNGESPYRLAMGAAGVTTRPSGSVVRDQVRDRLKGSSDDFDEARVSDSVMTLGGPEKREPVKAPIWHSWLLPGILVLAVLLIAQQAWKLMREMKAS